MFRSRSRNSGSRRWASKSSSGARTRAQCHLVFGEEPQDIEMIVAHALVRAAPALVPTLLKCARMCRDESRHGTQEWSACATISAIQTITKGVARTIGAKLSDIAQECVPRRHLCRRSDSFRAGCRPLPLCKRLLVMTRVARPLSRFDRAGVIIVALLGLCVGFLAAAATDTKLTLAFGIMSPGVLIGAGAGKLFGTATGVCVAALSNGAVCGLLLYAWDRITNTLVDRIAAWSRKTTARQE